MAKVECLCPPKAAGEVRHPDGDTVTLRPRLDFEAALTVKNTMLLARAATDDNAAIMAALTKQFIFVGVESWTVADAKGKPVPVTRESIAEILLTHQDAAMTVAEEADDLYAEAVVLPLLARASNSSQPSPTPASTSPKNGSTPKPRTPSRRSSTSTTPMAGTAATT